MELYNVVRKDDYANCGKTARRIFYPNPVYNCGDWNKNEQTKNCYINATVPDNIKDKNDAVGYKPNKCCIFHNSKNRENFCVPAREDKLSDYMQYYHLDNEDD